MFIKIILNYIIGYVKICVEGYYIERFINICTNKQMTIWKLKREKGTRLYLNIGIKDFKKITKIAKKTKCKVKIEKKRGFPFVLNKYKKRKIFALLLLIVIMLITFTSNYIWNIEIREENGEQLENLLEDLKQAGLTVGIMKNKVDTKYIINNIRLNRADIAWMGIELKGTNAIVKVVKADEEPSIIDKNDYCDIISDKNGIITKISAQNGTAQVKVGDTVKEGTTLISGWMEGKYTGIRYVHSIGEIQAKVWYTKSKKIYFKQEIQENTDNEENKYAIKVNNFKINLYKKLSNFNFYDTIETEKKLKVFSNFYLPISVIKTTNKEKQIVKKIYNVEEAKNIGIKELEEELDKEILDKENILRKEYKYTRKR